MNVPCKYTAFVGVDKTATPLTSEDVEMESCSNESFDLSSYNLTSPTSKPKSGFGKKFVEFFSSKQHCVISYVICWLKVL